MVYSVLKFCMRNCTFTIMGDVSQNIHYGYGLNDWEALRKLFLTGPYDSFELLRKSYRNTIEISNFAMRIFAARQFSDLSGRTDHKTRKRCDDGAAFG